MNLKVPKEISHVTETLQKGGFEAYIVGGCVRDQLLNRKIVDYDITTSATPDQIKLVYHKYKTMDFWGIVIATVTAATVAILPGFIWVGRVSERVKTLEDADAGGDPVAVSQTGTGVTLSDLADTSNASLVFPKPDNPTIRAVLFCSEK